MLFVNFVHCKNSTTEVLNAKFLSSRILTFLTVLGTRKWKYIEKVVLT